MGRHSDGVDVETSRLRNMVVLRGDTHSPLHLEYGIWIFQPFLLTFQFVCVETLIFIIVLSLCCEKNGERHTPVCR